jgi:hypothetical protein
LGIDGEYVDPKMLQIPQEKFLAFDLKQPLPIEKKIRSSSVIGSS